MKRVLLAACAAVLALPASAADLTVGFVYPSPVTDVGWSRQLDLGREAIEAAYGDRIETTVVENVPTGPDVARILNQLVTDGAGMIILGSFGYMNDGLRMTRGNPEVAALHASGFKQTANFGTFTARTYEGFYLAGLAAGMVTESDTIGIVAAFAIPEVVAEVNAIALAVHKVNPEAAVKVVWLNTWFDPPKEQEAARALVSQGADVLFSLNQDTPSIVNVAEAEGVRVVATSSDMRAYGPKSALASVTYDWSNYFVEEVGAKLDGNFEGRDFRGGLAEGAVKVIWGDGLDPAQTEALAAAEAELVAGTAHVFDGPLDDQKGAVRVEAGATLPDPDIFAMNWLVNGIDGALPN